MGQELSAVQTALYLFHRAVTALSRQHQKPHRAVNRPNANREVFGDRAVQILVHYTALFRSHYCTYDTHVRTMYVSLGRRVHMKLQRTTKGSTGKEQTPTTYLAYYNQVKSCFFDRRGVFAPGSPGRSRRRSARPMGNRPGSHPPGVSPSPSPCGRRGALPK